MNQQNPDSANRTKLAIFPLSPDRGCGNVLSVIPSVRHVTAGRLFASFLLLFFLSALPLHAKGGRALFLEHCAQCHGADGEGLDPNPPLKDSPWVTGDPERLIRIVLNGYAGRIRVGEEEYTGRMPSWRTILSDGQIASILTYLRSNRGGEKISADQVASVRGKTKGEPTTGPASSCMGGGGRRHCRHHRMGGRMGCGCGN